KENLMFANQTNDFSEILRDVSLPKSILSQFPSNLSIGVQKRVGLARAILQKPEVLILDEPTTGLDPIIGEQINILIKKLVKKK
ncbi:MAG: ATP-binding cassette domain-containing protein, partial [Alphaproteobacteria bacterium]